MNPYKERFKAIKEKYGTHIIDGFIALVIMGLLTGLVLWVTQ